MGRWTTLALVASATLLSQPLAASNDPMASVWSLLGEGRDLSAVDKLHTLAFGKDGNIADDMAAAMWAQFSPRLNGLIDTTPFEKGSADKPATPEDVAAVKSAEPRDAISTIVDMARNRRIVILNEEHDAPEDRAFGLSVAKALKPLGFTVLAAETFTNDKDPTKTDMSALAKRGYPIRSTGTYTSDPAFGDFVRQALGLGYRPIAYEQTAEQGINDSGNGIDEREEAEASNLAKAMTQFPQEKFFIYVGYSHAAKIPLREEDREKTHLWMAGRLKQKTGLDPLTIDQTTLGAANASLSSRLLRSIVQQRGITHPVILFSDDAPLRVGRYRDAVDLQVVHPITHITHGRPNWLETMGRKPARPASGLVPRSGRSLVQAFIASEGADAIPVDQAVLEPNNPRWFMLPDQPVRFVVKEHLSATGGAS